MMLRMLALLALATLAAAATPPAVPTGPGRPEAAAEVAGPRPLATHAALCRPSSAHRCSDAGCESADEGLHAEQFELDVEFRTVGACLYTDCYTGKARVVRDPAAPWLVTAFGVVHSDRREDGVPPPGSAPFPLTVSVDLRDGRFTAIWSLSPLGLQADFGTCELRGPTGPGRRSSRGARRGALGGLRAARAAGPPPVPPRGS
jgi:hypothetical protein